MHFLHRLFLHPYYEINRVGLSTSYMSKVFYDPSYKVVVDFIEDGEQTGCTGTSREKVVMRTDSGVLVISGTYHKLKYPEMPILPVLQEVGITIGSNKPCREVVMSGQKKQHYSIDMPFTNTVRYHYGDSGLVEPSDNVWNFLNDSRIIAGEFERRIANAKGNVKREEFMSMLDMSSREYLDEIGLKSTESNIKTATRILSAARNARLQMTELNVI